MAYKYAYCTVDEMAADQSDNGIGPDVLGRFIIPASQYLLAEIGQFFPMIETLHITGSGKETLFVPALLAVNGSIVNDEDTLVAADYILRADENTDRPAWLNGPYLRIDADPDATNLSVWSAESNSVTIPGIWGLYRRAENTGATIGTQQSDTASTLVVDDGSKISLGMLLEIGSEWQFVNSFGAVSAATTLASGLDGSSETVSLTSGAAVKVGEIIKVDFEQMKVLDIQTNSAFVARGWNKTKKASHLSGAAVSVYRTFGVDRAVNGSSAAAHLVGAVVSRLVMPDDINYLTRQIATLMFKKSQTGYAGRSGSPETGETFYTHEFPRDVIARVKSNYYIPETR